MGRDEGDAADDDRTMPDHDAPARSKPLLFYKLMVASILHDSKLKIPGKVVRRIEQELSIVVTLSVLDGRNWNMKLWKDGGKCWFGDGWVEFMKHYSIRVGYLLVFRYKGDSTFVVNIFNLSNAEIQYSADSVGCCEKVGQEKQCWVNKDKESGNEDIPENSDSSPPGFKSSQQTPGIGGRGLSPQSKESIQNDRGGSSLCCNLLVKDVTPGYYRAKVMSLKKTKQPRVRKAKNLQPKKPGNDDLGFVANDIKLNSPSKEELTPERQTSKKARTRDGVDVKIPEQGKLSLETQLPKNAANIEPSGEVTLDSTLKFSKKDQLGTRLIAAEVNAELRPKEELTSVISTNHDVGCTSSMKCEKVTNAAELLNHIMLTTDALNCTIEKTATVPKKQKTVQLSALSNSPINPYCMVHMRASYVEKKGFLHIPVIFASKYLKGASGYATLQNLEGKQWKVRLLSSNAKIKLGQGWYQFATDNYLKEGDIIILELLDSVNTLLKVSFIRSPMDPPPADQEVSKL